GPAVSEGLAQRRQVGNETEMLLQGSGWDTKPRLHLVQDEDGPVPVRQLDEALEERSLGSFHHLRSEDDGRELARMLVEEPFQGSWIARVVLEDLISEAAGDVGLEGQTPVVPS